MPEMPSRSRLVSTILQFTASACALALLVGIGCPLPDDGENNPDPKPNLGLVLLSAEQYDAIPEASPPNMGMLPSSVDLSPHMPPVGDQGDQKSCVAWAVGYYLKGYQEQVERSWGTDTPSHQFSPAYIYNQIKLGDAADCNSGCYLSDALSLLANKGCCTLRTMPYDPASCDVAPPGSADQEAFAFRISFWKRVNVGNPAQVKAHLASGLPVVVGLQVYSNFWQWRGTTAVYNQLEGDVQGYHSVCVTGYDDASGTFRIVNSLGTGWGDQGYASISYDLFTQLAVEGYIAVDAADPRHTITVQNRGEGNVTLDPPGGTYYQGTQVTLAAAPAFGWSFDHWEGTESNENPYTISVRTSRTITAVFVQTGPRYMLTTQTQGEGTVAISPDGGDYLVGTSVTLTPAPAQCWYFDHWEGDLTGNTSPATVIMDRDLAITAVFKSGTVVSGPIWSNTTWTKDQSPYCVAGQFQVPEGITLTIEPGVIVNFPGPDGLFIKGAIVANGTPSEKIVFAAQSAPGRAPQMLKFEGADLSTSQLSYCRMEDPKRNPYSQAIRLGQEAEHYERPKNTGTLLVSHVEVSGAELRTDGYATTAKLVLSDALLISAPVFGEYPLSEPIEIRDSILQGCQLTSELGNGGITLGNCTITNSRFICGGSIIFERSNLGSCVVETSGYNRYGPLNLQSCECTDVAISLPASNVTITDSTLAYTLSHSPAFIDYAPSAKVTVGSATIQYSTIQGNGSGTAIQWRDGGGLAYKGFNVSHCTITNNEIGLSLSGYASNDHTCVITDCNLTNNSVSAIDNRTSAVNATTNYWGTTDANQISALIYDYFDDINLGKVTFQPFSATSFPDAGPRP